MEKDEILSSEKYYRKTRKHFKRMEKWLQEFYLYDEKPDYRSFPMHKKGDLILILKPEHLYIPEIDPWPNLTNHVSRHYFNNVDFLKITAAEVIGYSDIPYYDPWEKDMKLRCIDDKVRYMDATPDEKNPDFIFVPHLKALEQFQEFIKYYAEGENEAKAKRLLKKVYAEVKL